MKHIVKFEASGRGKAQCPPNPDYPHGIVVAEGLDAVMPACKVELPYPAPECGFFLIDCQICGVRFAVTAAGRADDPVAVFIPCGEGTVQ